MKSGGENQNTVPENEQVGASITLSDLGKITTALQSVSSDLADLKKTLQDCCRRHGDRGSDADGFRSARCTCRPQSDGANLVCAPGTIEHATWAHTSSLCSQLVNLGKRHGTSHAMRDLFTKDALPFFGLDNASATYPFVDLWGLPQGSVDRTHELGKTFPNDTDCWLSFKAYKDTAHALFPVLEDAEALEDELLQFLLTRRGAHNSDDKKHTTEDSIFGKDLGWVGLMFAVLASGSQCSSLECSQRELTSKVYICCSFECLRMTNFLAGPDTRTIQTLLILGNVLCNNVNVGVAWSLLGLTIRLCQTQEFLQRLATGDGRHPREASTLTGRLWGCIMWQDSFLSVTDGRAPSVVGHGSVLLKAGPRPRTYVECSTQLSKVTMDLLQDRSRWESLHKSAANTVRLQQEIEDIVSNAADHLRDRRLARSRQERIESAALYLLTSHVTSELCRPALDPELDDCILAKRLRVTCVDALTNTIDAFLLLQGITVFARRSWFAVYRALSCAILLAALRTPEQDPRVSSLVTRLVSTLDGTQDPTEMSSSMEGLLQTIKTLLRPTE